MQSFGTWEHGPLASECPDQRPGQIPIGEQTNMYQNKVTLIGFLGSDPELRNNGTGRFTTLSVATKSSYRKDEAYVARTEWHHCIVFGKLSEVAATLKKGTHLQVEGELRSREYVNPKTGSAQRIWEVRVGSILKLDRAAKASTPEEPVEESPQEEAEP
jgi:single-strand DNA-binding protein